MKKYVCFAILSLVLASLAQVSTRTSMQDFAKRYKAATSEEQRVHLCIDFINRGAICRGGPIGNIDQIFGTDYSRKPPAKGQPDETGVVNFTNPRQPPPSDAVGAASTGWYLAFKFDYQGSIQDYHLSNLHK